MKPFTQALTEMPTHRRIHLAGVIVLVVGVLCAMALYAVAAYGGDTPSVPDFSADRRFNYEMERVGGKFTVYLAAFNRWLAGLWHGTNLAYTVGVLSVLTALACFWLANFLSYPLPQDTLHPPDPSS